MLCANLSLVPSLLSVSLRRCLPVPWLEPGEEAGMGLVPKRLTDLRGADRTVLTQN